MLVLLVNNIASFIYKIQKPDRVSRAFVCLESTDKHSCVNLFNNLYRDKNGFNKPIPNSYKERERNSSGHYPVVSELNLKKIIEDE